MREGWHQSNVDFSLDVADNCFVTRRVTPRAEESGAFVLQRDIHQVMSSCLCKYGEGAGFPFQIESLEDGVDDSVHTFNVDKADHGSGAPPNFHEAALDHVGGAQFAPQMPGKGEQI